MTTPLAKLLKTRIALEGPLTVAQYMEICLADPDHGYYVGRPQDPFGRSGDFITGPEISQIYGELIGLWGADYWQRHDFAPPLRLIELGPGRGTLMADAARALAQALPDSPAPEIHLIETSPGLRAAQRDALASLRPNWHDRFEDVPPGPGIVIASEFFDALPVRQFQRSVGPAAGLWRERLVTLIADQLAFVYGPPLAADMIPSDLAASRFAGARVGDKIEISPLSQSIAGAVANRLATHGGAALIIDYGYAAGHGEITQGDTLQAITGHRYTDPLAAPGQADLTAHVDFAGLAASASMEGGATNQIGLWGPVNQGIFLERLGSGQRAEQLVRNADPAQRKDIETALARLTADAAMGRLFKAMALTGPEATAAPVGFMPNERNSANQG